MVGLESSVACAVILLLTLICNATVKSLIILTLVFIETSDHLGIPFACFS